MDTLSKTDRSKLMARIRSTNTTPERGLRTILRRMGIRHRAYAKHLPGTPDVVVAKSRVVIFVHGCFWHQHKGCAACRTPKTRKAFWREKFQGNIRRDRRAARMLRQLGWSVLTVWECQLKKPQRVQARLEKVMAAKGDPKKRIDKFGEKPRQSRINQAD